VRNVPKWWEYSVEALTGQMLLRLTWYQYFNNRHTDHIHFRLTEADRALPIVTDPAFLSLVTRTGNFIPTPSAAQLIVNVNKSLLVLCGRINSALKCHVHRRLIDESSTEATKLGLPDWTPNQLQLTTD
jgi:hypothetical protein